MTKDEKRPDLLRFATAAAMFGVAAHVVGKAARDALFVSTFPASALPWVFLATGVASGVAVAIYGRLSARRSPRTLAPVLPVAVALSLLGMWLWLRTGERAAVAVLYAWLTITGTLVISAFWSLLSELVDVRTARRTIGLLTVASSVGGLVGAVVTHWLVVVAGARALLVPLAAINLVIAALLWRMARAAPATDRRDERAGGLRSGLMALAGDRYLRSIATLVAATAIAGTVADFALKSSAAAAIADETSLTEFFATYHGVVGGVTLGVQLLLARPLLQRHGMVASLAVLPAILLLGSAGLYLVPPLVAASALRGGESAARNSFHRAAYELLFIPVRTDVKRVAKLVVDTLVERAGDAVGALLLIAIVALDLERVAPGVIVALAALVSLSLLPSIRRGYVVCLTENLADRAAIDISVAVESDATARHTLQLSLAGGKRSAIVQEREVAPGGTLMAAAEPPDRLVEAIRRLRSPDPDTARAALASWDGDRRTLPFVTGLLADDLFEAALDALVPHAERHAGALSDELCDPARPVAVRKRIPRVLAHARSDRAVAGLFAVLADRELIVRYHAVRALRALRARGVAIDAARIWQTLRDEVRQAMPLWEAQRLLEEGEPSPPLREAVARRGAAGLRHVFNLLALVLEPEPVDLAYRAVVGRDEGVRAVALEYLEHVLPPDLRASLWPYVGDAPDAPAPVSQRAVHEVLAELRATR